MMMSVLAERVGQEWMVSLVPPQVAVALAEHGAKAGAATGGAVVLVAGRGRSKCEIFKPEIRIKLHEPDG